MKLITVPIDDEMANRLRDAAEAECRTVRWQAAAELRRALGLSVTAQPHKQAPTVAAAEARDAVTNTN